MSDKPAPWWHPKFNILGTSNGRKTAFFLLYLTEGLPNGFACVAIVAQMRRQGLPISLVGGFAAAFVLPWAFKWAMGPFVDLFYCERLGRRRLWILIMQAMMCVTLLAVMPFDIVEHIKWLTILVIVHNIFAATQDVAIDALACDTLEEHERGVVNGLMFAGAYTGEAIGGAGVLFLLGIGLTLNIACLAVVAVILSITLLVTMRLGEKPLPERVSFQGSRAYELAMELLAYCIEAFKAFFGSRRSLIGLGVALLPTGAYALSLVLCTNLSLELGMTDKVIAQVVFMGTMIVVPSCVLGGYLSDKLGRRKILVMSVLGTAIPSLMLAWAMHRQGWIMPVPLDQVNRPDPGDTLIHVYVVAIALFSFFHGIIRGTRSAMFMDICHPAVAATQFTAYMALMNLVVAFATKWQCSIVEKIGYPKTLLIDVSIGMLCLLLIPFMTKHEVVAKTEA